MEGLNRVMAYLKKLPPDFYGQVIVRVKHGKAVLIEEQKTTKLDDEQDSSARISEDRTG